MRKKLTVNLKEEKVNTYLKTNLLSKKNKRRTKTTSKQKKK